MLESEIAALIQRKTETAHHDYKSGFEWKKDNRDHQLGLLRDMMGMANTQQISMSSRCVQKLFTGYRPAVYAREGLMLGMCQPLARPVFEKLEDAEYWSISAMVDHFDRLLGMSDAVIRPFKGMVDCGSTKSDPALLRDIQRICEEMAKERADRLKSDLDAPLHHIAMHLHGCSLGFRPDRTIIDEPNKIAVRTVHWCSQLQSLRTTKCCVRVAA